jgi:protocatechuate 3,4-dioxygenase beta subunit
MTRVGVTCALALLLVGCEARSPGAPSPGTQAPPQGLTYAVSGTVSNAMGVPVEGAQVEAIGQYNCENNPPTYPESPPTPCYTDQVLGATNTDNAGRFTISGLPNAYVRIDASKDGQTVSTGVYVSQDSTVALVLH